MSGGLSEERYANQLFQSSVLVSSWEGRGMFS